jgi:hypothetical protein
MTLFILAYLGGLLAIVSPCILPVLPFVFARAGRPFVSSTLPMLAGMAVTSAAVATLAAAGGGWPWKTWLAWPRHRFGSASLNSLGRGSTEAKAACRRRGTPAASSGHRLGYAPAAASAALSVALGRSAALHFSGSAR